MSMVVVRHTVVYPWAMTVIISTVPCGPYGALTDHSSLRTARISYNAYCAGVSAPYSLHKSGVHRTVVAP